MTLYITRHGESLTNIDADMQSAFRVGVRNNVLTPAGIHQALDYGNWLKLETDKLQNVIVSPYARTKQTAYLICSVLGTMVPIHYNRKFREIDWKIAGRFHRLLDEQVPDFNSKTLPILEQPRVDYRRRAYTLESPAMVYDRVTAEFSRIYTRYAPNGEDLLIVTHFFPVRSLRAFIEHGKVDDMRSFDVRNLARISYSHEQVMERLGV